MHAKDTNKHVFFFFEDNYPELRSETPSGKKREQILLSMGHLI